MTRDELGQPEVVIDPSLPKKIRALIEAKRWKPAHPPRDSALWSAVPPLLIGGAGMGVAGMVWWLLSRAARPDEIDGHRLEPNVGDELYQHLADAIAAMMLPGTVLVLAWAVLTVLWDADRNSTGSCMSTGTGSSSPASSPNAGRELLGRTQQAVTGIVTSAVHDQDLIDRQRNAVELPVQTWEIARALADLPSNDEEPVGDESTAVSERVARLQADRRRLLDARLASIERRVVALEEYAARTREADARYAEWLRARELAEGNEDLLRRLAETAAEERAVGEIERMSAEAKAVARSFATALDSVREAAAEVLPATAA